MKTISSNKPHCFKKKPECLATIGVFDGVHKGHRYLIDRVKTKADKQSLKSLLVSFYPHPREFSHKRFAGYLNTPREKSNILKGLGLDYFWNIEYNSCIKNMSGRDFIEYVLKYFSVKEFLVGEDFKFGVDAENNVKDLRNICKEKKVKVHSVKKRKIKNKIINSSYIRTLAKRADFKKAKIFMGRAYSIGGIVEKGLSVGKKDLETPTVNMSVDNKVLPPLGVYLTKVEYKKKVYPAVSNLGFSPTIKKDGPLLETHILGFNKNIHKDFLEVIFLQKIRPEKEFSSVDTLKKQIKKDIATAKKFFSLHNMLCLP